jgi:hypothetical protein
VPFIPTWRKKQSCTTILQRNYIFGWFEAVEEQSYEGVNFWWKTIPMILISSLLGKWKNVYAYIKQTYSGKRHLYHQNLYLVTSQDKIQFPFLNIEVILLLVLSVIITNCSRERPFHSWKWLRMNCRHQYHKKSSLH